MTLQEIRLLYAYDRWANARVWAAISQIQVQVEEKRPDREGERPCIWETWVHILGAEWGWLARWLESPQPPGPDPASCRTLSELRVRWSEVERAQGEFLARLTEPALDREVSYERPPGTRWTYPLRWMLQHVVNHSSYHRGQIATMLRQAGGKPVPTDFLVFIDEMRKNGG